MSVQAHKNGLMPFLPIRTVLGTLQISQLVVPFVVLLAVSNEPAGYGTSTAFQPFVLRVPRRGGVLVFDLNFPIYVNGRYIKNSAKREYAAPDMWYRNQ